MIENKSLSKKNAPNIACSGQVLTLPSLEGIQSIRVFLRSGFYLSILALATYNSPIEH